MVVEKAWTTWTLFGLKKKKFFMCNHNTQFRLSYKEDLDLEFKPRYCFDCNNINWNRCSLALRNLEL